MSAIDRIFIATNVEVVDLEDNADRSLCRYEFYEILVRMANTKFAEKGQCKSVHDALQRVIDEFIMPNSVEKMEGQQWRINELWTLEVDLLFKANLKSIQKVFSKFSNIFKVFGLFSSNIKKYIQHEEVLKLLESTKL